MAEIEVPPFFLCPISLQMMKDPVTISTGITYDRESIEKWVFSGKNSNCPVTKQVLTEVELTPNITLRRLIQAWCTVNASNGVERFPTPKPPVSKTQILKLLEDAKSAQLQNKCLQRLRSIAAENETNRRSMEAAGAAEFLASIVRKSHFQEVLSEDVFEFSQPCDDALSILYNLKLSENGLLSLFGRNNEFIESLIHVMQNGSYESRTYSVLLLKSMFEVADPSQVTSLRPEFLAETVQILQDQISPKASKAALKLLIGICPWGRNRIKAVEAGAVQILIDLVLDSTEKRVLEMMFIVLDQLCQCPEGRAELLKHGAGLAVVSKKILRVSSLVSERGVKILYSIAKFSATNGVLQEMLNLGVVGKLSLVIQVDCGVKIREKAKEILKKHARVWKNSSCVPTNVYPC